MAERKQSGKAAEDEEVPAFFKNLGSGSPKPRQKFCGMFCPVEGSSENKTIDFDSLSVGRGSGQVVAQQRDVAHLGPDPQPPYSRQGRRAGGEPSVESGRKVEIRRASGKEALQNIYDQVGIGWWRCLRWTTGRRDRPSLAPLPARWRTEHPSVTTVLPLPASVHAPHPTRPFSAKGMGRCGLRCGGCAPTKAACASLGLRGGGGKGWADPWPGVARWGMGMGRGSILLKSSRAASDCSCGWVPHPFLDAAQSVQGGTA